MPATRLLSAMVATWNNVATTFTGLKLNVTDTASASGSLLMDLQVGGASKFSVNKFGRVVIGDDLQANSAVSVTNNAGLFKLGAYGDVVLARDAANTLALRNGTAAQAFKAFNTYTDASNGEWADFTWTGNQFYIGTGKNGTGSSRQLNFVVGSSVRWAIDTNGHFLANTDNTYDIGASGASRPRNVYAGSDLIAANKVRGSYFTDPGGTTRFDISGGGVVLIPTGQNLQLGATSSFSWVGQSKVTSPSDGSILFQNNAGTDFTRLILGTNDTSGVAIKKSGTTINLVLGDDSGRANLTAGIIATTNSTVVGLPSAATAGVGARSFVTDANATMAAGIGTAVVGGGSNKVPVYSDGTNWLIG